MAINGIRANRCEKYHIGCVGNKTRDEAIRPSIKETFILLRFSVIKIEIYLCNDKNAVAYK